MEIPKNLDTWYEDGSGPVVIVVQPMQGVGGQSSATQILDQPYGMLFPSREAAQDYHTENQKMFERCRMVACYPVFEKQITSQFD